MTRNVRNFATAVATSAALAITCAATAQEEGKPEAAEIQTGADLALANDLAAYGDRTDSALALILAAQMKKQIPTQVGDRGEKAAVSGAAPPEKTTGQGSSVDELLTRARALARGQADLIGLIDDVESMTTRGDVEGAGCYRGRVYSGYTDTWTITFTRGANWVELDGDGDTDLDLQVFSGDGRLLCSSLDYRDREFCSWNQYQTGRIRVEVENLGGVYNNYDLCTN